MLVLNWDTSTLPLAAPISSSVPTPDSWPAVPPPHTLYIILDMAIKLANNRESPVMPRLVEPD